MNKITKKIKATTARCLCFLISQEPKDFKKIPIFINNYNRLTTTTNLVPFYFFISVLLFSCKSDDDCGEINCSLPYTEFTFDILDKLTGKNVFVENNYDPAALKLFNTDNLEEGIEFNFSDDDLYLVQLDPIRSRLNIKNFTFQIADDILFLLEIETEENEGCCPDTYYSKVEIKSSEFRKNEDNGNHEILIDR